MVGLEPALLAAETNRNGDEIPPKTGADVKWFVSTDRKDHANHAHDPEVGFWRFGWHG